MPSAHDVAQGMDLFLLGHQIPTLRLDLHLTEAGLLLGVGAEGAVVTGIEVAAERSTMIGIVIGMALVQGRALRRGATANGTTVTETAAFSITTLGRETLGKIVSGRLVPRQTEHPTNHCHCLGTYRHRRSPRRRHPSDQSRIERLRQ